MTSNTSRVVVSGQGSTGTTVVNDELVAHLVVPGSPGRAWCLWGYEGGPVDVSAPAWPPAWESFPSFLPGRAGARVLRSEMRAPGTGGFEDDGSTDPKLLDLAMRSLPPGRLTRAEPDAVVQPPDT